MAKTSKKKRGCLSALLGWSDDSRGNITTSMTPPDGKDADAFPYRLRDDFLSNAEHSFYLILKSMMGTYFTICPKVSLADILFVTNPDRNMSAYNRINRKHVDFLICESQTMMPRFAIELDDKSHNRRDRMERDDFVDELFATAELPLIRVPVRPSYNTNELGVLFREALAVKVHQPQVQPGQPFTTPVSEVTSSPQPSTGSGYGQPPLCPKCGQPMVLRTASTGANRGKTFWGCINYPKCKEIIAKD